MPDLVAIEADQLAIAQLEGPKIPSVSAALCVEAIAAEDVCHGDPKVHLASRVVVILVTVRAPWRPGVGQMTAEGRLALEGQPAGAHMRKDEIAEEAMVELLKRCETSGVALHAALVAPVPRVAARPKCVDVRAPSERLGDLLAEVRVVESGEIAVRTFLQHRQERRCEGVAVDIVAEDHLVLQSKWRRGRGRQWDSPANHAC
mmetsp:Transcript_49915/g.139742  ORF Transcript_49915/g.139742 Transcript_49915/m.139742 type:complete len:203 (-) Transcript_49915:23-631(-)